MQVSRLFDIFPYQAATYPQADALAGKYDGKWKSFSSQYVVEYSDKLAAGLLSLEIKPGDRIAIFSDNCVEWLLLNEAALKMGGIVVPIYSTCSTKDLAYILNHSEAKAIFTRGKALTAKVKSVASECPNLAHIYNFYAFDGDNHYSKLAIEVTEQAAKELNDIQDGIGPMDLATIIYTSGTTGNPKGVMLSHNNIISDVIACMDRLPVGKEHKSLSFLPLSHVYERMVVRLYQFAGVSIYFAESLDTIGDNLKEVKPHVFTAVPRLLEKVFDRIMAKGNESTGLKKKIFDWAVKLALKWEPDGQNGFIYGLKLKIADTLVYKKFRDAVGGNVLAVASGSAALQPRLARFFNAANIPLKEGYGLTESSPVIAVNGYRPGELKIGTVGKIINVGQVKIAEDGEILYKGPNVMMGYYKQDDTTQEVIKDGWLHTGDIGEVDAEGFLKITDRKKEIFKTSGGKYIAPQVLENKFKESVYVEQIVVVGEYRKFPSALIVPNFEALRGWMADEKIEGVDSSDKELIKNKKVLSLFRAEMDRLNESFAQFEKIKKIRLLPEELSIEKGEITPTLKIKRKAINERYKELIDSMYN